MRSVVRTVGLVLACGMVIGVQSMAAPTTLPFLDGFEDSAPGTLDTSGAWDTNGVGTATVQNTDKIQGTNGCSVSHADLTLEVSAAALYSNVWCQVYSKPTPYDDATEPSVSDSSAAAFYLSTGGVIRAYNGGELPVASGAGNVALS